MKFDITDTFHLLRYTYEQIWKQEQWIVKMLEGTVLYERVLEILLDHSMSFTYEYIAVRW